MLRSLLVGALCMLCCLPGCKRGRKQPHSDQGVRELIIDVPVPPSASHEQAQFLDVASSTYRVTYSVPAEASYASFYERAGDAQGWHCTWMSGTTIPWCAVFHKPGRILIVEQREDVITLYGGTRLTQ